MANPFEEKRERGTIVSWSGMGIGRIRADNGDSIDLFYWSLLQGFRQLTVGQRVEFSRAWLGLKRNTASLVVPVPADADSD
jgi:cold shock CspA family protein